MNLNRFTNFIRRRPIVCILILAIVVRVLLFLIFPLPDQTGGDFALYQRIADNILTQGNLGGEPQKTYGSPSISPGFAFFLAGYEFFFGNSVTALVSVSIILGGLLAVGTYLLAALFFNERIAFLAGAIASVWPVFLIQTFHYGMSISLYSVSLLFGVYVLAKAVRSGSTTYAVGAGALLGFAALVDAIGLFVLLVLVAWLLFEWQGWRTVQLFVLLLIGTGLILAPWMYRNVTVSHTVEQKEIPVVSKDELRHVSPSGLSHIARLVTEEGVLWSGLTKMYVFPYDISVLDQRSVETEVQRVAYSYKERLRKLVQEGNVELSDKEWAILVAKIIITLMHWAILGLAIVAVVELCRKRAWSFPALAILLTGYVTVAVIGFGSLAQDDFQSISGPNSFLFPLIPFFIILASFSLARLYE